MPNDPLARLVDEAAIRDVTARFANTAIRGDFDGFRRCWCDDAIWTIAKPFEARADGADDIVAMLHRLWDDKEFFVQFAVQGPIIITGDEATATCVCHEAASGRGEIYYRNHGMFTDRLRRSGEKWLFSSRAYDYLWLDLSPSPAMRSNCRSPCSPSSSH